MSIYDDVEEHACVDRAHDVQMDGKGHSGMCLTMGRVEMINDSKKLGLVTTSSSKIEVVADVDRFPK